jgi:hypothetical protein
MTDNDWVDGNELAGALQEVFAVDVTVGRGRCAGCGHDCAVAELRVYDRAPGRVGRCPRCLAVVLRVVRGPGRVWVDLGGFTCLELAVPDGA